MTPQTAHVPYRGRFAPSPTGPLHFGSLVAALGSYLDARHRDGEWLVRIEDIDPPREVAGASDAILRALEAFALQWDGEVLYQSRRSDAYQEALDRLRTRELVFPCTCSRKQLSEHLGGGPLVYPGTCRYRREPIRGRHSLRVRVPDRNIDFTDRLQGRFAQAMAQEVGDFVVRRADQQFSYQLAVVVDDSAQGITDIVRGSDLLDSTPRQILLQQWLGAATPRYLHLPVATNRSMQKLSKQTHARPLDPRHPAAELFDALLFLGQRPPSELRGTAPAELLTWANENWNIGSIPPTLAVPCSGHDG